MKFPVPFVLVLLFLFFLPGAVAHAGESPLPFTTLSLSEPLAVLPGSRFIHGHLGVTLSNGHVAPVLSDGRPVGLFFAGVGAIEYRSEDPVEHSILRHNLRRATGLEPIEGANAIRSGRRRSRAESRR